MPEGGREWIKEALGLEPMNWLFAKNYFFCALTPELSRTDLRPWASETCKYLHEAAKRARLERIVRHVTLEPEVFQVLGVRPESNLFAPRI